MVDIIHRIGIKNSIEKVYNGVASLQGLAGWWTEEVKGSDKLGEKIEFYFRTKTGDLLGKMVMQVEELNQSKSVRWKV